MQSFILCLSVLLVCQAAPGFYLGELLENKRPPTENFDGVGHLESSTSLEGSGELLKDDTLASSSISEYRSDRGNSEASSMNGSTSSTDPSELNSSHSTAGAESSRASNWSVSNIEMSTETFNNASDSNHSDEHPFSQSPVSAETWSSSTLVVVTTSSEINKSSNSSSVAPSDEPEGVVLVANTKHAVPENATTPEAKTLYQRTLELLTDTYTLSILVPVAAGIVFASTIIVTIATCRCLRRRCRRRQLRRKTLPDSVKNLRPSDRARLLAESSDEEF